jgi:predicted nuclease of predicted toxin-antitoxin system
MADLVIQLGSPPQILWITCGNTSNNKLKTILTKAWSVAERLITTGERIVEISDITG